MNPDICDIIRDYTRVTKWRNIRIVSRGWQVKVAKYYYGTFDSLAAAIQKRKRVRARFGMTVLEQADTQMDDIVLAKTPKCICRVGNKYQLKVKGKYYGTFETCREAVIMRDEILES